MNDFEIVGDFEELAPQRIAVIGMSGRFPGARDLDEFWENLRNGVEAISFFTDQEVLRTGVDPELLRNPHYVKAAGVLEDVDRFDASFFGFFPREAAFMDPQQRVFLECAWEALERAGYDPFRYPHPVGVFAGVGMNTYLLFNLYHKLNIAGSAELYGVTLGNDKDFLTTRVSYKLNLRGPSVAVQTACSTSLVAVHLACQSLLEYQCDMALAGGVSIRFPQKRGYLYQEGGIASPDGHCRAFDARAQGTVGGNGAGVVVLKRLDDALADGDHIHGVILATAMNNDGSQKVGFTAPGVEGQATVIATAQALAGVDPESISYIEAHGTGTALGDPIEVAALTQAFRSGGASRTQYCALGSVKPNIGHLDAAAGVAGLIKAILALEHGEIPPSINFERPNPQLELERTPFYVNNRLAPWKTDGPRRAGVSSFGLGGTNVHAVLEEAPQPQPTSPSRPWQLLPLSAQTEAALETMTANLVDHLMQHPELDLADVAYTLQVGRRPFEHRRVAVCRDLEEAITLLGMPEPKRVPTAVTESQERPVAFLFSGQGAQYVDMGRELYETEPTFRQAVDDACRLLEPHLGQDLRRWLYPSPEEAEQAQEMLRQTALTQPALFVIEYALAQLWMEWGVQPEAMLGHSIGELVAACLAGVFSLEDGLALVAARGRLMQEMPPGAMLSLPLTEEQAQPFLNDELTLAAINAPNLCVISGPLEAIAALEQRLDGEGIAYRRLHTSHAFHSPMMEPVREAFARRMAQVTLHPPQIPFISNVTGTWITPEQATDPGYWAQHLRQPVRFAAGVATLLQETDAALLEVGPGVTLSSLARRHPQASKDRAILASLRHPREAQSDVAFILESLGKLWLAGVAIDWQGFHAHEFRHRVPLPTYPFQRQRFWVEPGELPAIQPSKLAKREQVADWFYLPSWQRADMPRSATAPDGRARWLLFLDELGLGQSLAAQLEEQGASVITVAPGEGFARLREGAYALDPRQPQEFRRLFQELAEQGRLPDRLVHLGAVALPSQAWEDPQVVQEQMERGFYSLLFLLQGLGAVDDGQARQLHVITANAQEVTGLESLQPATAALLGLCRSLPQEFPHLAWRSVDILLPETGSQPREETVARLLQELTQAMEPEAQEQVVAHRGRHRWVQTFQPVDPERVAGPERSLRPQGVVLITGGLGNLGLTLAQLLAEKAQARLVLTGRSPFPTRDSWEAWLAEHGDDDPVSRKIRRIQALEAAGAQVWVAQADVADLDQMAALLARIDREWGGLHGVIHAAGLVGQQALAPIRELDRAQVQALFRPKIQGTLVLRQLLKGRELDFCLLQSSLATVLGGLGYGAYAAANAFMDALATRLHQEEATSWISVDWDAWHFGEHEENFGQESAFLARLRELAIRPEEGIRAFQQLLALGNQPQVIVSTGDLPTRLAQQGRSQDELDGIQTDALGPEDLHPRPELRTEFVAPRDELEQAIAQLWQEILGLEAVGVEDDFFELGGHSLLATQLISRLRDLYQVELPLQEVFEQPTVAGLAGLIRAGQAASAGTALPPVEPAPRDGDLPLSFGQQRLWFLEQLEPGNALYNNFAAVRIQGELDVATLEQSINQIVRRHESLRTVFREKDGVPVQVILDEQPISVQVDDLAALSQEEQQARILALAEEEARQPFDLGQGPLLRVRLLRLGAQEHVIFLTIHHIVSDGWSVGVLLQELAAFYQAIREGEPAQLPELPIQYPDYAIWQQKWLQGPVLEEQLSYWREQLAELPVLELPTDRPRPRVQSSRGANLWFHIPQELTQALASRCQEEGATLFMGLMAAFQTLLHRYTGQEDFGVGTPIANRNRSETEGLIGFLLNTLVLRADLAGEPSFRELLARVRETALAAYDHQDLPFEMVVEALQPERDMSRSPLFQVMFDLQTAPLTGLEMGGLTFQPLPVERAPAKFDLALSLEEHPDGLRGYLNYNTDLFDRETVQAMVGHFCHLLEQLVAQPDQPVTRLPLLTPEERQRILGAWSGAEDEIPPIPFRSVAQRFQEQAAIQPDATALVLDGQEMSYGELNARANQLAHHLRGLGVEPGQPVLLFSERTPEAIVGLLAIFKLGAVYLPVEPSTPAERLAFILEDAQVRAVLTQERLADKLPIANLQSPISVIRLDADWPTIAQESTEDLPVTLAPEETAYIIYTSGSTGAPKGVCIAQESIAAHLQVIGEHFQLTPQDRVLQFASLSFDQSLEQILATLTAGATLVMRGPALWPPEEFSRVVAEQGLTVVNLPPIYWSQWVRAAARNPGAVPENRLRLVIVGGDVMPGSDVRLWQRTPWAGVPLLNAYGPTETTITALTHPAPGDFPGERVPIGRPLPGRRIYVLDRYGQPVPAGVPGELYIGGLGLAKGYLNRPELTAERFVSAEKLGVGSWKSEAGQAAPPDSLLLTPYSSRLYRTGDLCRFRRDGVVEFLGRVDDQVKVRGFRIELGEIEAILQQHPDVREAVVLAREDVPGEKRLVAYVVAQESEVGSRESEDGDREADLTPYSSLIPELRTFLAERLPDYMIPAAFVFLDALPLTASGKVNRRALPAPDAAATLTSVYVPPRTPVEEELAAIWAQVLDFQPTEERPSIGIHDNFFDLGGHSLLATQIIARVRAKYHVELPLRRLFETPTVAGLAELITESLVQEESEEELAQLLEELEGLSDDAVRDLLSNMES